MQQEIHLDLFSGIGGFHLGLVDAGWNFSKHYFSEVEVSRLQGFPDTWTDFGNYDGEIKTIAKTQRYKLLGNAVSKPIVQVIGTKLLQNNNAKA